MISTHHFPALLLSTTCTSSSVPLHTVKYAEQSAQLITKYILLLRAMIQTGENTGPEVEREQGLGKRHATVPSDLLLFDLTTDDRLCDDVSYSTLHPYTAHQCVWFIWRREMQSCNKQNTREKLLDQSEHSLELGGWQDLEKAIRQYSLYFFWKPAACCYCTRMSFLLHCDHTTLNAVIKP